MLTQTEADMLIAMQKTFASPSTISLSLGMDVTYELIGADEKEKFLLDLWRGTIRLSKLRYQTRGRKVIVLVRLDVDSSPHTNPEALSLGGLIYIFIGKGLMINGLILWISGNSAMLRTLTRHWRIFAGIAISQKFLRFRTD